jgi:predicted Zn finger-like uncharacterized protein
MIVACPNCAARFRVSDEALGVHGRHVRCGNCGHGWVQKPRQAILEINHRFPRTEKRWKKDEPAPAAPMARGPSRGLVDMAMEEMAPSFPPPPSRPAPPPPPPPPPPPRMVEPEPEPEPPQAATDNALEMQAETVVETVAPAEDKSKKPAKPAKPAREGKRSIAAAIGWLLLLLTVAGLGVAVFAQGEIMARFPETRAIYQAFRFPVPPPGEGLEVVVATTTRGSSAGTPTMEVRGKVRNVADSARAVPALRAALIDERGTAQAQEDVKLDVARLDPGEETEFAVVFANPPPSAQSLTIVFVNRH